MKTSYKDIKVRDLIKGFSDESDHEGPVVGYEGKLNIRPAYQREFVYPEYKQVRVIETILENCPLGLIYWAVNPDGTFELMDGQQRTMSICNYINNEYSVNGLNFHSLLSEETKNKILDYELKVVLFEGTNEEKLKWFEKINEQGMVLDPQELRNSVYVGPWLMEAKRFFSKNNSPAKKISSRFIHLKDGWNRQKGLEIALKFVADRDYGSDKDEEIRKYMTTHQFDTDACDIITLFRDVVDWVDKTFIGTYPEMKNVKPTVWYKLYKQYKDKTLNPHTIDAEIQKLLDDDDVTSKTGIWEYVLDHNEYHLNLRAFSDRVKNVVYRKQGGICPICGEWHDISEMEADHIIPWSKGGTTDESNCQMLCRRCNRVKSDK